MNQSKQKLIVDGQLFQTAAWHRGMGKYSLELLDSLTKILPSEHWSSIDIVLTKHIKLPREILTHIKEKVPTARIVYLDLKLDEIGNPSIALHNRRVVDQFVNTYLEKDIPLSYLILSVMQGVIYPVFPSEPAVRKFVLFYDLIPLMFYKIYLKNPITRNEYLPRINELLRADKFLAISKTVANDLAIILGVDRCRIVSIDGGAIPHSSSVKPLSVPMPFILMPTGNDLRKNNRRAIMGFKYFNQRHNNRYTLVVTSFFKEHEIAELSKLSDNVVFTGNISGAQLNYLYEQATALLFPSEYEGLGMPILEAIEKNKPIACSNIAVFREISTTAFIYFDPRAVVEIAEALERVTREDYSPNSKEYTSILKHYTWQRTAAKALAVLSDRDPVSALPKTNVIIFGPNPSQSEVGRIMQEVHAELSRRYNVSYVWETVPSVPEARINFLPYTAEGQENQPGLRLPTDNLAAPLYHISNEPGCARTLLVALGYPGVVVLHDLLLDKAWNALVEGKLVSTSRIELEARLEVAYTSPHTRHLASLLCNQKAIIVFSAAAAKTVQNLLERMGVNTPVITVSRPVASLVYRDALPEKTSMVHEVRNDSPYYFAVPPYSDYQNIVDISASSCVVFPLHYSIQQVLEAMRFGVVPYVLHDDGAELPQRFVHRYDVAEEANKEAEALAGEHETFLYESQANIAYIQEKHQPYVLVEALQALLADKQKESDE